MYGLTIVKYTETDCSYSIVDSSLTQSKEVWQKFIVLIALDQKYDFCRLNINEFQHFLKVSKIINKGGITLKWPLTPLLSISLLIKRMYICFFIALGAFCFVTRFLYLVGQTL